MQKKMLLALVVVVIVVVSAVAAIQLMPKPASPEARNIKIGLVAPVSGSPIGQDMERAARMAVDEINNAGGIYVSAWNTKVNITIVVADTVNDAPGNAVTPVTRAVETDGVDLLIGGYGSAGTLANEIVAIENRVPYIIAGASNELVTRRGPQGNYGGLGAQGTYSISDEEGMSYVFHYCTTTLDYSKTVVQFFANEMKPLVAEDRDFRLALLYRNDAFGTGVAQATKFWIENLSLPITIVADRSYETTTTNYQTDLTAVKSTNPDAVFVVDNPDKTPLIIKQGWNEVGLKSVYIAVENNQDPAFYTLLGETGSGQLLESKLDPFMSPSYLPAVEEYSEKFLELYDVYPGMMGADTYDAFYVAKDAIERAGTLDKAEVRTAIENTDLPQMLIMTESGRIRFSTGINYHEISPVTFIEQLYWDNTSNALKSRIVWSPFSPGGMELKQADFALPTGYQAGSP
ncbi:MAG: ABC transporter substrate-binding protein [Candidatus Bathyarchaeota archaeon]|nr:ABC transporter substrate-binding protein [Candidatus Bathyarchaeota archaeon]